MVQIKICGVTTPEALAAAGPADYVGFVFFEKSPRAIRPREAARLAGTGRDKTGPLRVGLFVDADDAKLQEAVAEARLDLVQLHGREDPERVRAIRALTGRPVMKAARVAGAGDIEQAKRFTDVADWLIFDAHVPGQAGGTGQVFDWNLLKGFRSPKPWMLSGGLNAANIRAALSVLRPDAVDVSSGVESALGRKDPALITDFIATVRAL